MEHVHVWHNGRHLCRLQSNAHLRFCFLIDRILVRAHAQPEYCAHTRHNGLFRAADAFILLSLPFSCGSGESSTGALCVRYWEDPWDFLCFWAFLMDFLVKPSTFSDAEMADILMLGTWDELACPPGGMKGVLFCSHQREHTQPADRMSTLAQVLYYSAGSNMVTRCWCYESQGGLFWGLRVSTNTSTIFKTNQPAAPMS